MLSLSSWDLMLACLVVRTELICLPPSMATLTRQTSHPAMCWGDTKTTPTSLNDCELGISRTVHTAKTNGGQILLQRQGTGGTQRNPKRDLGIKTVALHIFHRSPRHSPRETQGGGEFLISNIACASLLYCTRNSLHSLLALLLLILKTQLAKTLAAYSTGLSLDNRNSIWQKQNVMSDFAAFYTCADVYNDAEHQELFIHNFANYLLLVHLAVFTKLLRAYVKAYFYVVL